MKKLDADLSQDYSKGLAQTSDSSKHYPTITFTTDEELDLPMVGKITFVYKVLRAVSEKDETEKHTYTCNLELHTAVSAEAAKDDRPSKRDTTTEDTLDRLMREHESNESDEDEGEE